MKKITSLLESDVALGAAVMLLRGAIERLGDALKEANPSDIFRERVYSKTVSCIYRRSKQQAPVDSLLTRRYIYVGDIALKELDTKSQIAVDSLRSSLRCC